MPDPFLLPKAGPDELAALRMIAFHCPEVIGTFEAMYINRRGEIMVKLDGTWQRLLAVCNRLI